jgi:bifunctional non-homologous end joining protein LigD
MKLDCGPKGRAATPARFLAWQVQRQGPVAVARSDPERFTAAPQGATQGPHLHRLSAQRRARTEVPLVAPTTWKETATIDGPSHWHIGDAAELVRRELEALAAWGRADLVLPAL